MTIKVAFVALLLLSAPCIAKAQSLPDMGPIPFARPDVFNSPASAIEALTNTAAVGPNVINDPGGQSANQRALIAGLDALSGGDPATARTLRDHLQEKSLERRILTWALALSASETFSSAEITALAMELKDWPGMLTLREHAERALHREKQPPQVVTNLLGDAAPRTFEGTVALAQSYLALEDKEKARALVSRFWRSAKLDTSRETFFLDAFDDLLSQADHRVRMERMLYENRVRSAERVAARAGGSALMKAWAAVIRGDRNAQALLDAVPETEQSAGYIFARARFLRRAEQFEEAAKLMLTAPRDAESLIDPDEWWIERRVLSRELLDIGDAETAYKLAAAHSAESPSRAADAEFHAGWYALRALKDPAKAAPHFARIAAVAEGPISNARANYWLGRAAEAGGPGEATAYFEEAARFGATFYGQLATARLGSTTLAAAAPEPTDEDRRHFSAREMVRAIQSLEQTNHAWRAGSLYRKLAETLENPGELTLLARMAEARGDYTTALRVGKIAGGRGLDIGALAHPVGAIPAAASIPSARQALAYAIARQETEFNAAAVSPAGARGLLQLMPATAQEMARKSGLPYSRARLTSDPSYNATLGAAYLEEQLSRFNGSYILTFAGYNAGPSRANEWMERYGDPRGKPVEEVVDWIERIPYSETRNYVQRVMENLQVYKMRLTGRFDVLSDLSAGG
ncbi:transglycosylase SLT domain-containing protein [Nitratireductor kimnyeongensis]|uniref:Transglycosylase SLT domain-containing protein n=1 Tax=Nitratireductor kimnyeongensis TaxID=430679 RepID=A0ABW0T5J5_9HYPH|nr:lytic transglycosylase domain-containing protein [Nitratireductor kimnyeongensis]QZZ35061.1 lytic transglycosylase domain-containing protein [Nitratireductor kimnyeongensis]